MEPTPDAAPTAGAAPVPIAAAEPAADPQADAHLPAKELPPAERRLPFSYGRPLLAGALFGLALRLVFSGEPGNAYETMSGAFILLAPMLVGAVTVYVAERTRRHSWSYYFLAPFLANVLLVVGTLIIMIEGLICVLLMIRRRLISAACAR